MESIGIVVPNYNGARYLEAALQSIVDQRYPALRCHVADGGSRDDSLSIIRRFADVHPWLTFDSGPDGGQAAAIAAGFARLPTDLVGWLNSDDELCAGALERIARAADACPDVVLFHGDVDRIDEQGNVIGRTTSRDLTWEEMRRGRCRTVQPGSFYRRWAVEAAGSVDPSYHLLMDVDLWIRLTRLGPSTRIPATLARFRVHEAAKSSQAPWKYYRETLRLAFAHQRDRLPRALMERGWQIVKHQARARLEG